MISVFVADVASCLLREDCSVGQPLKLAFPELFSFMKKPNVSLKNAISVSPTFRLFNLPLSVEAFDQFQHIQNILQTFLPTGDADSWYFIWGTSIFTSKEAYCQLLGTSWTASILKWIWKSSC
jgi:hypothetical protein